MSPVARKPRHRPRADGGPGGGLLVRRPVTPGWLGKLPQAPPSVEVTVSLTDATAAIRHAAELAALGYVPVGAAGCPADDEGSADFLVPRAVAAARKGWLRELLGPEGRLYEPAMGPVRALLGGILEAHEA